MTTEATARYLKRKEEAARAAAEASALKGALDKQIKDSLTTQ